MAKYEHELGALDGLGLDDVEMDAALTFVLAFVRSAAVAAAGRRPRRGMTDEQWWARAGPLLARSSTRTRYPPAARVGTAAGAAQGGAYDADARVRRSGWSGCSTGSGRSSVAAAALAGRELQPVAPRVAA